MEHPEGTSQVGLALRDEILEAMRAGAPDMAEKVRKFARHLCHRNIGLAWYHIPHTFTTDDLRERLPGDFLDSIGDNRFFGAVVGKRSDFTAVGWKITRQPGNHGRQIRLFTIPEYLEVVRGYQRNNPDTF